MPLYRNIDNFIYACFFVVAFAFPQIHQSMSVNAVTTFKAHITGVLTLTCGVSMVVVSSGLFQFFAQPFVSYVYSN